MDRKLRKYLSDILSSIMEIESFMEGRPREYSTFCSVMTYSSAEVLKGTWR